MRLPSICRLKAIGRRYTGSIVFPIVFSVVVFGWYKMQGTVNETGQGVEEIKQQKMIKEKKDTETVKSI